MSIEEKVPKYAVYEKTELDWRLICRRQIARDLDQDRIKGPSGVLKNAFIPPFPKIPASKDKQCAPGGDLSTPPVETFLYR